MTSSRSSLLLTALIVASLAFAGITFGSLAGATQAHADSAVGCNTCSMGPTPQYIGPAPESSSECPSGQEWEMIPVFVFEVPACAPPEANAENYPDAGE